METGIATEISAIKTSTTWCILSWLTKVPAWIWLVLIGSGTALLWIKQHDALIKAEAIAQIEGAKADSLRTMLASRDSIMAKQDSLIAIQTEAIKSQQVRLAQASVDAQNQTGSAVATLRSQLSEAMKPLLDSVTKGYEKQLEIKNQQIDAERKINSLLLIQISQRDSTLAAVRRLNESLSAQLSLANKRVSKSLKDKAVDALPWVFAGYLVGRS